MATKVETDSSILNQIGNTPLVKLDSLTNDNVTYFAKLEGHNPFGSVKDRAAYWMIKDAEERGILKKNESIIIEPTSGNTGIALTGIANLLGYKVEIVIPEKASEETKNIIDSLGAKLFQTSDDLCPKVGAGTDQSIALARAISSARPDIYYMPNQYENEANFMGHYKGTGPEIWKQTQGKVTHFLTGVGTGGTITGVSAYLKEQNPKVKTIAVQPQQNHLIQGLRTFVESDQPVLFKKRENLVDDWMTITNEEAFVAVRKLFETEKLSLDEGCVVGIFADDGRKFKSLYAQQKVFTEEQFDKALKEAVHLSKA